MACARYIVRRVDGEDDRHLVWDNMENRIVVIDERECGGLTYLEAFRAACNLDPSRLRNE